ncbi:hypothetical protein FRB94_011911 [Tulasnella sp. JGI-2019a]|nr:hypothetical protein FRB94_011911 [Tulasnella sp. JGI-2019a]
MLDIAINQQAVVSASGEQVLSGIDITEAHSTSKSQKPHKRDDGKSDRPSDEGDHAEVKAELKGSWLSASLSLLLPCTSYRRRQQRASQTDVSDEPGSNVAATDPVRSLQDALRASQAAFDRFLASQHDENIDDCIERWENVLELCPIDHGIRSSILSNLANLLQVRFDRRGDQADLAEIIHRQKETLSLWPTGHALRLLCLNHLGNAFRTRFNLRGDITDLDENIRYHEEALAIRPVDHPDSASAFSKLGNAFKTRFDRRGDMVDLNESIHHHRKALSLRPTGHLDRLVSLSSLGIALGTRFDRAGDVADLEEGIRHHQEALSLCPIGHSDRPSYLSNLGYVLQTRFYQSGDLVDLERSIGLHREALSLWPRGHPNRSSALRNLGSTLGMRFDCAGVMSDLEESIGYFEEALSLCTIDHPDYSSSLSNLGIALRTRFDRRGAETDLDESIRYHQEALSLRPAGNPERPSSLNNLGNALGTRFIRRGKIVDLEQSIAHLQDAFHRFPVGHPDLPSCINSLGNAFRARFNLKGDMVDLEESISYHLKALPLCPVGNSDRPSALHSLGNALKTRFDWKGGEGDLEESIRYHQEAFSLWPNDHPDRPSCLNDLGKAFRARFDHRGNMTDLEESIRYHREALSLSPTLHPDYSHSLSCLGAVLQTRFERGNDMADLDESIRHHQEALSLRPTGHPSRSDSLNDLGVALDKRFHSRGDVADLNESIHHHEEALSVRPVGHPDRATSLNNLGNALQVRFDWNGDISDLEKTITHHREALSLRPIGHPDHSYSLNNLGNALQSLFERTGEKADLQESVQHYTDAAGHKLSPLSARLPSAHNWIIAARKYDLESLGDAYAAYLNLLDRSLLLAATSIPDTHAHLVQINKDERSVTEDATSHAIGHNQLSMAVQIAERGRALLFTQLGNYRTPLKELEDVNGKLAHRLRALGTELENSSTISSQKMISGLGAGDQVARGQKMVADWDSTIEQIHQLQGFEHFLDITPFAKLQEAAVDGPVILVNISHYSSFAIIITASGDPLSVPLPEATPSAVLALAIMQIESTTSPAEEPKSDQRLMEVLQGLWGKIVAPIVLQLETTLGLPVGSRIWWMPTSTAWWLPLHAAGPYKSGERNLPDRFVSSYTPTLSSLINSRTGYQPVKKISGPLVLVVAEAEAEGETVLWNVDDEVAIIRGLTKAVTVIEGENCKRDEVLNGLKQTDWVHFSCHGHQHPTEPFKSHFALRTLETSLTLLDIIKNGLPQAELAVLSACHSAAGDKITPDEAINLAAGVLFAGFRSVVGTMWAMDDRDGPVMAKAFYKHMFRNGPKEVDCRDAAKALVMGVRELRRNKVPFQRWINLVHYGI